jgi:magnesium-protoporphyrin IX monomethyl ester (oxidative) cyclase
VRDHQRPAFHKALGVDPDWYGHEVFTKTSEMTKQIFPITLDIDNPRWQSGLVKLQKANADLARAKTETGIGAWLRRTGAQARAATAFVGLYTIPAKKHAVPASTRLEPAY